MGRLPDEEARAPLVWLAIRGTHKLGDGISDRLAGGGADRNIIRPGHAGQEQEDQEASHSGASPIMMGGPALFAVDPETVPVFPLPDKSISVLSPHNGQNPT